MCGIVGYNIEAFNALDLTLSSLKHLEYRGYDSVGLSFMQNGKIVTKKIAGRIDDLSSQFTQEENSQIAIGHTRWSTHGKPTVENAHPHHVGNVSLVHNGIIENYKELKEELLFEGCVFKSTTDSEVIAHFIAQALKKHTPCKAIEQVLAKFTGKYAVAFLIEGDNTVYAFRSSGSPMIIGVLDNGYTLASDFNTVSHHTNRFIIMEDRQYALLTSKTARFFNAKGEVIQKTPIIKDIQTTKFTKDGFETFMMKEIHEQPQVVRNLLLHYTKNGKISLNIPAISRFDKISIIACGTSFFAGSLGKYIIESYAAIPVTVEISSEFSHRKQPFAKNTLYIFASQSGETADTIAAMEYTIANKTPCSKILSILNSVQSSMAQKSDFILECFAGPEIGVASTKNFVAQLVVFYLLTLQSNSSLEHLIIDELIRIPYAIEAILANHNTMQAIEKTVESIINAKKVVFTGRTFLFPIACEGALKLSELSYILVQSIASGEFKHGPIAIVDDTTIAISITHSQNMYQKTLLSNEEILSRNGTVIVISDSTSADISVTEASDFTHTYPILLTIVIQLLSYYTAEKLGNDIDKPRNLAKSVTVE
jgi:glucosamine--fructose-6-phosphate aminotransferase (isomerizing)